MAKSDCMLAIVWLLKSRGRMTAKELADTLEISVRSVYRYVDSLCASGVPIQAESGHEGGYQLAKAYQSVPLFFTSEERTALAHSALFAQQAGYPFTTALTSALQKIEYYSTADQNKDVILHAHGVNVVASADHSAYRSILADLEQASAYRQTVTISYKKAKGEHDVVRQIDPYGLINWRDRWYVVAYCHLRQEIRIFRIDRISQHTPTSANFLRPDGFSAGDFFSAHQIRTTLETDKLRRVLLSGDSDAIDELTKHWFLGPRLVTKSNNEALFLIEENGVTSYVAHLLLPYGRSVKISEPTSLKEHMVELLSKLVTHYQDLH